MTFVRHLPRFRRAYRELETLAERERWPRARIEARQLEQINAVWAHAVHHVPYYRDLRRAGAPEGFGSLEAFRETVPVLAKELVRADPGAFLSENPAPGMWWRTGGSTGTPMRNYWGHDAHRENLRAGYRFLQAWGVDFFDRSAAVWGHSASFAAGLAGIVERIRMPIEDRLRNRLRLSAYDLSPATLREYLRRIAAFRPAMVYGYSSALHLLAQEAAKSGFSCDALRLFVLTGEPALPHQVQTIERVFGVPAAVEYGAIECGLIALEWPDRTLRVREDHILVETLPRDDGRYEIVTSVLHNPSFPLLRYAVADVTDEPLEQPSEGFAILRNVAGRDNEFVLTRSGRRLHSSRFDALFKYHRPAIRRFRVRQRVDGSLDVKLEVHDPAAAFDSGALEGELSRLVDGWPARVAVVDAIPQTSAGKHRLVVSDLGARPESGNGAAGNGAPDARTAAPPNASRVVVARAEEPAARRPGKAAALRGLLVRPRLDFLLEAHNGLSAKIVEEAGFEAIWASGLSISAALGVRDSNEASWTQVLEVLEFMNDAVRIPILVDGDTGYGNFNNMRRLVRKLEQRGVAGVCIEDKVFPKTNSFLKGQTQALADVEEFCGRIRAGKDSQSSDDFVVVARCEALIAGWGVGEALERAEAYRRAGADAILVHSAERVPHEILAFLEEWENRLPVVLVPTKYYATPTDAFRRHQVSALIWANHLMRACITAMQRTAQQIFEDETLVDVEDAVAPLAEVFRLQGAHELAEAEKRYLPKHAAVTRAVILAASRGAELGEMTAHKPKCMVEVGGETILSRIVAAYRAAGVRDVAVVRGYRKEAVAVPGVATYDNDEVETTGQAWSLWKAAEALEGHTIVSFGDVLFKKYIAQELLEMDADFAVAVDAEARRGPRGEASPHAVACTRGYSRRAAASPSVLVRVGAPAGWEPHGEWTGFLKLSGRGARVVREVLAALPEERRRAMSMADLLNELISARHEIRVVYTMGSWMDIDSVDDVLVASRFP